MASGFTCGASGDQHKYLKILTKRRSSKKGDQKNPYSDRGIDKFSALLEEVEEKKRMIYSQLNPEDVSLIRFVGTGDNKLKPVIVRSASSISKEYKADVEVKQDRPHHHHHHVAEQVVELEAVGDEIGIKKHENFDDQDQEAVFKEVKLPSVEIQPWYYYYMLLLGGMVILVVVLMAMFGKYWKTFYMLQLQATICPTSASVTHTHTHT